ncbi:MAG: group I truncated hemoglobin [Moraxellaceae bacterium]
MNKTNMNLKLVAMTAAAFFVQGGLTLLPLPAAAASDSVPLVRCCGDDMTVYRDFGEREGIQRLMEDFMRDLLADDRTRPFFEKVDQQRVILMLTEQFCHAAGGPCEYRGRSMTDAHAGMGVKREHFNALVEVLQKSMTRAGIPFRSQNRMLAVFAPMYRDIEQR